MRVGFCDEWKRALRQCISVPMLDVVTLRFISSGNMSPFEE